VRQASPAERAAEGGHSENYRISEFRRCILKQERQAVLQVIYEAIDETNDLLPEDGKVTKSPETVLFGRAGVLDSLGLVSLIVNTEQIVERTFGKAVSLTSEKAMSEANSPFQTVESLTDFIIVALVE
jgi:acyl carrier protein